MGVSLRLILPLMSFAIVELSSLLRRRSTCWPSSSTRARSYEGLPQSCPFQPGGMPGVPTGIFDQSSTRKRSAATAALSAVNTRTAHRRTRRILILRSHPTGFDAQPRPFILVSERDPVGQQRAGVARIDDLLDTEGFGGSERAAHGVEPPFDLGQQGRAIGSRVELAAVGGLDAPLERQRAPVTRRPGVTQTEGLDAGVTGAGAAGQASHGDGDPGDRRLLERLQRGDGARAA